MNFARPRFCHGCERLVVSLLLIMPLIWCQVCGIDESYVLMTRDYVRVPREDSSVVKVEVERRAPFQDQLPPLRATLLWGVFGSNERRHEEYVEWASGEYGIKNVTIRLKTPLSWTAGDDTVLVAEVTQVINGSIATNKARTIIGAIREEELPLFDMVENTTFTYGESLELEIVLKNGSVKGNSPSLIQYSYTTVVEEDFERYVSHPIESSGIVRFQPGTSSQSLKLPFSWKGVPAQSRSSIEMTLMPLFKSRLQKSGKPFFAAHILGTQRGRCPPGSSRAESPPSGGADAQSHQGGEELNVTIGDVPVEISLHGKDKSPIALYRRYGMLTDDIVAVVDTTVDRIQVCMSPSSLVDVRAGGLGGGKAMLPLGTNVICPQNMSEYQLSLSIGWDKITIGKNTSDIVKDNNSTVTLTVRRKADEQHALLQSLEIVQSNGKTIMACERSQPAITVKRKEHAAGIMLKEHINECTPNDIIRVELDAESVQIVPHLLVDDVPGVRVEMNGQVVVYTGQNNGIEQEQYSDSHPFSDVPKENSNRVVTDAYIMNLPLGFEVPVEIVVFAEDGTTSSSLTVKLFRKGLLSKGMHTSTDISRYPSLESILKGQTDFQQCTVCMPGWVSAMPDSPKCALCSPGTFAEYDGTRCTPCMEGTYAMSWGSRQCKHCIEGTYAPHRGSKFCTVCPDSKTTQGDGQGSCNMPLQELNVKHRYAVLIHVSVQLSGIDEDTLILKSGVSGSPNRLISNLVTSDMAKAFNTTKAAVSVKSIRRLSDRNFETNISASLPVYIPPSATEEDISTALQVERLSADSPLEMLAKAPDTFFGQTTDVLQAHVESTAFQTEEHFPERKDDLMVSLVVIGSLGIIGGLVLVVTAIKRRKDAPPSWLESRFLLPRQNSGFSSMPSRTMHIQ